MSKDAEFNGIPIIDEPSERLVPRHHAPEFGKASPSYFEESLPHALPGAALHEGVGGPVDETPDPISPVYYERGGISFSQIVDAWQLNPWEAFVVKYLLRGKFKGEHLEDLRKAQWCLGHEIARVEAQMKNEERD